MSSIDVERPPGVFISTTSAAACTDSARPMAWPRKDWVAPSISPSSEAVTTVGCAPAAAALVTPPESSAMVAAAAVSQNRRPGMMPLNIRRVDGNHYALALIGADRPGIVAAVAGAIRRHLQARTSALDVHLDVWPIATSEPEGAATHVLRLHGRDRIGI